MKKLERKFQIQFIGSLLAVMTATGLLGWLLLRYAWPHYYFGWYPAIPVYFIGLSLVMSVAVGYCRKRMPQKIVIVLMMARGVKLILTLGLLLLYYWLVRERMAEMLLTTLAFYFIHLFAETTLFYRLEKKTKRIS